ncbi:MAG: chorismate-binding protein, partial [Betaproteobacteria bacterium]
MNSCIDFSAALAPSAPRLRHAFRAPRAVLSARGLAEVRPVLDAVFAAAQAGAWCVGYVRYEAAPAFDAALQVHAAQGPLAWFAVHDEALPWPGEAAADAADVAHVEWTSGPSRAEFDAALARIHQAIGDGELYQVNYTAPLSGQLLQGSAQALFQALQRSQPGGYAAFIDTGNEQVLSVSPELFFDWESGAHGDPAGGAILARPMKGTAPRGATPAQDVANAEHLRSSPKERAENVMIVDLLRNDISRIALPHSVRVPALFATEALPTVWQMTSDVTARTRPGTTLT